MLSIQHVFACLPACPPARLPACPPARLPACPPARLPGLAVPSQLALPSPSMQSFTEEDWQYHLTWRRYIPEPRILVIVVLSLAPVWMWSVLVSACVGLYATYAEPAGAPNLTQHPEFIMPFTLASFALSLLMLFKTTSR